MRERPTDGSRSNNVCSPKKPREKRTKRWKNIELNYRWARSLENSFLKDGTKRRMDPKTRGEVKPEGNGMYFGSRNRWCGSQVDKTFCALVQDVHAGCPSWISRKSRPQSRFLSFKWIYKAWNGLGWKVLEIIESNRLQTASLRIVGLDAELEEGQK